MASVSMSSSSQRYAMSSSSTSRAGVRESPFRETEWDRRLDNMLEDLEGSAGQSRANAGLASGGNAGFASGGFSSSAANQSSSSNFRSQMQQSSSSSSRTNNRELQVQDFGLTNGHHTGPVSHHTGQADVFLKDLEGSLKETSNYIESRRQARPGGGHSSERSQYRTYAGEGGEGFDLERHVQHMMPGGSASAAASSSYSRTQTGNATSTQQKQTQSYSSSSYKVRSS